MKMAKFLKKSSQNCSEVMNYLCYFCLLDGGQVGCVQAFAQSDGPFSALKHSGTEGKAERDNARRVNE